MGLKYEPASEPLHSSVKLSLNQELYRRALMGGAGKAAEGEEGVLVLSWVSVSAPPLHMEASDTKHVFSILGVGLLLLYCSQA